MAGVLRLTVAGAVAVLGTAALAQWSPAAAGDQPALNAGDGPGVTDERQRKALSMKLKLLDQLINTSSAAKRIRGSDDMEAKELLNRAEQHRLNALNAMQGGALNESEDFVASGLAAAQQAMRKVTDAGRQQEIRRREYEELRTRVISFSEAFQRTVNDKPGEGVAKLLDQVEVDRLLGDAERLAALGDLPAANKKLTRAAHDVERALSQARDNETLLHELKFDSPEAEYEHEKRRNGSYVKLIAMFGSKKVLKGSRAQYVERMLGENETLCGEAQALFERGDTESALRTLEQGTQKLERALRASGVAF